eukprot:9917969-Ditylum_brightwellii.AAC.2
MPPRFSAKQWSSSSCGPQPWKQMGRYIRSLASFEIAEHMVPVDVVTSLLIPSLSSLLNASFGHLNVKTQRHCTLEVVALGSEKG